MLKVFSIPDRLGTLDRLQATHRRQLIEGDHLIPWEDWYDAPTDLPIQGELLRLPGGSEGEAEESISQAVEVAASMSAKSLELRAAMSLARLWQKQGKVPEAKAILTGIYGWLTEGFDTPDLIDSKALLEELA